MTKSGQKAHELLPAVHQVAADLKRFLTGNLYGAVTGGHLQSYLEEFTFRWNRKSSRYRGQLFYRLMECAVESPPLHYDTLAKIHRKMPKGNKPQLPETRFLGRRQYEIGDGRPWLAVSRSQ